MLVFCLSQIDWCWYQLITDGLKELFFVGINKGMAEQWHEIIGHDNKIPASLGRPEVVGDKVIYGEVVFQFLDPVLGIHPSTIRIIHYLGRQFKVGDETVVTLFAEIILIFEKH